MDAYNTLCLNGSFVLSYMIIKMFCVFILDDRIIYVAYKTGNRYTGKVFDPDLGYVYTYALDGQFIYADKVRVIAHLPYKVSPHG